GIGLGVGDAADDAGLLAPWIAGLLVDRDGVMGLGVDAVLDQESHQLVAPLGFLGLDDIEVEDVAVAFQRDRQIEGLATFEAFGVALGPLAADVVIRVNVFEFGAKDAGVQVVQAAVEAVTVDVARGRAVIAQPADGLIDVGVVGYKSSAVAEGAEVLLDDEAGGGGIAELANLEFRAAGTDSLGVVLDDLEFMLLGNLADGGHVGALAVKE